MNTNRDLLRMRHVRKSGMNLLTSLPTKKHKEAWENYKKGFDALAGAVLVGGLVQALLLSLKGGEEKSKHRKNAATALVGWLESPDAHCPTVTVPRDVTDNRLEGFVAYLISMQNVPEAMAIQAEALRYLSQAKLVAGAFSTGSAKTHDNREDDHVEAIEKV